MCTTWLCVRGPAYKRASAHSCCVRHGAASTSARPFLQDDRLTCFAPMRLMSQTISRLSRLELASTVGCCGHQDTCRTGGRGPHRSAVSSQHTYSSQELML